jgi:hypothetical protein
VTERRPLGSDYLEWAKLRSDARYNLTSSGLPYFPLRELPVTLAELELNGSGAYGWPPLQQAVADRYSVDVNCVVAAAGTSMANHLALALLLADGGEALIEHPSYDPILSVARYLGAEVTRFPRRAEDGFRIDPDDVARAVTPRTRVIALTNLHNPSSARTDDATLRALADVARSVGAKVLVDEVYLDTVWDEGPRTSFDLGPEFVVTSSLTKAYGLNGLRAGWIFAEPSVAARLWRLNELFSNINAHPAERLALAALEHIDAIALRARRILEANGAALNAFYRDRPDLDVRPYEHGTVSFPRLTAGSVDGLCDLLRRKHETTVVPGRFFEMPDHFRVALGVAPETFAEGLRRLGLALDELAGDA